MASRSWRVDSDKLAEIIKPVRYRRGVRPKTDPNMRAPKRVHTNVRIPPEIYGSLLLEANFLKESLTDVIERALRLYSFMRTNVPGLWTSIGEVSMQQTKATGVTGAEGADKKMKDNG